ncbi:TPA: transposase [Stenotrophomonas maltophilia]|nr:transposase [Stenotrophomonas maltophilia]HDS1026562.1 transposase [Stenotrophomonas maltophilia]HDS1030434.1 transposase [Stenotrophomonas maltophilia]HDS1035325.1 transposase [Stenotrophomonas maltophilia]
MASPKLRYGRHSSTGTVYSLTTITMDREAFFADAANVAVLVDALRFVERAGVSHSLAWVVMPDHLHWLMELQKGTLAECMSLLKSRSGRLLNQQLGRRGALWQHGYHDHAVRNDESLHEKAKYIMANPIRAGLASEVGEYPYAWCRWPL